MLSAYAHAYALRKRLAGPLAFATAAMAALIAFAAPVGDPISGTLIGLAGLTYVGLIGQRLRARRSR